MLTPVKLIEPKDLFNSIDKETLIIDLCDEQVYLAGHIPSAIHVDKNEILLGVPPAPGALPTIDDLNELFSRIGLTKSKQVIVYDDEGGGWAGRFIWMLDVIGHQRFAYLNGGLRAWVLENLPLESKINIPKSTEYMVSIHPEFIANLDYVLNHLHDDKVVIWDARSPNEFRGEKVVANKGGHIPGAVNFEWTKAMDPQRGYRIRDKAELLRELASLGISPEKEIITHCQTHHRSGFTYLVARHLGFPHVRAYPGSWAEWGNHPSTPVEK